ncbi:MAG: glycosyltransferase family 9 protein [Chitinispirillaceae bacterium]|nr:glycosyltransferase family 9 protein [Chitinispirillaceae bacterium]
MRRIIVTPLIGIGDVLMTTPALELLKQADGDTAITYCTMNRGTHDVLLGNPAIDRLIYAPMLGPHKFVALWQILRSYTGRYDVCINFYPSNRIHYNLFALLTLAPLRIGHTYLRMNVSPCNWLKNRTISEDDATHCVEENVRLLKLLGIDPSGSAIPSLRLYLTKEEIAEGLSFRNRQGGQPLVGIHAGTSVLKNQAARRWPKERFAELIRAVPNARFAIFGTAEEEEVNASIIETSHARERITLVNTATIRQVAAMIRACDFFISNDSGLMHIAAAVNTPVVALIGPTNPAYIYPWNVHHRIVTASTPCRHCFHYSPAPLRCTSTVQFECVQGITVPLVLDGVNDFLRRFSGRGRTL